MLFRLEAFFAMKKKFMGILGCLLIFNLFGWHQVKNKVEEIKQPDQVKNQEKEVKQPDETKKQEEEVKQSDEAKDKIGEMVQPKHEKIEEARGVLDKVLEYIAEHDSELAFGEGQLLDAELGVPRFETVPISEIKHFEDKDVVEGFIVRPVVGVEDPYLLIVVEAVDKSASENLNKAMGKVKSDQQAQFRDADILTKYRINDNKTTRQGNYLIYVTWEKSEEIVKIFEQHVR